MDAQTRLDEVVVHLVFLELDLNLAGGVPENQKRDAAEVTDFVDPAGDGDRVTGLGVGRVRSVSHTTWFPTVRLKHRVFAARVGHSQNLLPAFEKP